jgi:hypothetical protein
MLRPLHKSVVMIYTNYLIYKKERKKLALLKLYIYIV